MRLLFGAVCVLAVVVRSWAAPPSSPTAPSPLAASSPVAPVIPWPKFIQAGGPELAMTQDTRIVCLDPSLRPQAEVLQNDIYLCTSLKPALADGPPRAGDIVLALSAGLKGEQYELAVGEQAVVRGAAPRAVAWGAVTLLQCLHQGQGQHRLVGLTVRDEPLAGYRGLLIDVARQWHSVESLRPLIQLCRLYKINYLQLHLNDQQSMTFPSKAFPQLQSVTKGQRRTYTEQELRDLVAYADRRGVTLVPELEGPGHHSGALRSIWGRPGTSCLDMGNEKTYQGLDTLVGEICDVFASSPYVHIGADECSLSGVGQSDQEKEYMAAHGLSGAGGLYNHYIVRMNEIVRKRGKRTIVWEGFHGEGGGGAKIPKDVIVMPFESTYNSADKLVARGYTVINTAWRPLYVVNARAWPAQYIYENWNLWLWQHHVNLKCHIQLQRSDAVLGAQMCAWEQPAERELPSLRPRLHAMSERIWNPDAARSYADFAARAERTDRLLDRVLGAVEVRVTGQTQPEDRGFIPFRGALTVELACPPIGTIRYTLDGTDPAPASPAYAAPITIDQSRTRAEKLFFNSRTKRFEASGDVVRLKARIFDASGTGLGEVVTVRAFWHKPLTEPAAVTAPSRDTGTAAGPPSAGPGR